MLLNSGERFRDLGVRCGKALYKDPWVNWDYFTMRITFKPMDRNLGKFSEVVFKLYSLLLFNIFVVVWIIIAVLAI